MNALDLIAATKARRTEAGLVANNGVACASVAQRDYYIFRDEMRQRDDWGNLPADLETKLIAMKQATRLYRTEAWA